MSNKSKRKQINLSEDDFDHLLGGITIAFKPIFAFICQNLEAGVMLSQAWWMQLHKADKDGWWEKPVDEWTRETTLLRGPQERAKKKLKDFGFLEDRGAKGKKKSYRLNREAVRKKALEWIGKNGAQAPPEPASDNGLDFDGPDSDQESDGKLPPVGVPALAKPAVADPFDQIGDRFLNRPDQKYAQNAPTSTLDLRVGYAQSAPTSTLDLSVHHAQNERTTTLDLRVPSPPLEGERLFKDGHLEGGEILRGEFKGDELEKDHPTPGAPVYLSDAGNEENQFIPTAQDLVDASVERELLGLPPCDMVQATSNFNGWLLKRDNWKDYPSRAAKRARWLRWIKEEDTKKRGTYRKSPIVPKGLNNENRASLPIPEATINRKPYQNTLDYIKRRKLQPDSTGTDNG